MCGYRTLNGKYTYLRGILCLFTHQHELRHMFIFAHTAPQENSTLGIEKKICH